MKIQNERIVGDIGVAGGDTSASSVHRPRRAFLANTCNGGRPTQAKQKTKLK